MRNNLQNVNFFQRLHQQQHPVIVAEFKDKFKSQLKKKSNKV